MTRILMAILLTVVGLAGCGVDTVVPEPAPTGTATATRTPTATPPPTATLGLGANIGFMGVLRADETLLDPSEVDAAGRSVYLRPNGSGFVLVVDAKPGINQQPVGLSAFDSNLADPSARPDLQILLSRSIGDGSSFVCDNTEDNFGGVPGVDPPSFDETQAISDAINDLGCRFNDGTGNPRGRLAVDACVLYPDGEFRFVDPDATVEFCGFMSRPLAFPPGDTVVTARVRDQAGLVGPERQIVIRVASP